MIYADRYVWLMQHTLCYEL